MTDHPNDLDPGLDDAPWLRQALHDVADAEPVRDARAEILDAARGVVVPLRPSERRTSAPPRRWLAVAAVVLALAGLGGAVVLAGGGDDDANIRTNPGEDPSTTTTEGPTTTTTTPPPEVTAPVVAVTTSVPPTSTTTTPPVAAAPTGWYVPDALPDGWRVTGVTYEPRTDLPGICPCRSGRWSGPGGTFIDARSSVAPSPDPLRLVQDGFSEVAVASGPTVWQRAVPAPDGVGGTDTLSAWARPDGRWIEILTHDLDEANVGALIRAWHEVDATEPLPVPPGFTALEQVEVGAGVMNAPSVMIEVANGSVEGYVQLSTSWPAEPPSTTFLHEPVEVANVPGSSGYLMVLQESARFRGFFPGGTTVQIAGLGMGQTDAVALARSLRPATAEGWATFVRTAGGPAEVAVPGIGDLVQQAGA